MEEALIHCALVSLGAVAAVAMICSPVSAKPIDRVAESSATISITLRVPPKLMGVIQRPPVGVGKGIAEPGKICFHTNLHEGFFTVFLISTAEPNKMEFRRRELHRAICRQVDAGKVIGFSLPSDENSLEPMLVLMSPL